MGLSQDPEPRALVHTGSPAFSHAFLRAAAEVFAGLPGWLDVDGYLFEALTHDESAWAAERERDAGLRALLDGCPDFYQRVRRLRQRLEQQRGHALRIAVIDLGTELHWGDVGQLDKARSVYAALTEPGAAGDFARALAALDAVGPDRFGNRCLGAVGVPDDGSVRDCVIVDSVLGRGHARGAVVVRSRLERFALAPGAVALECRVRGLRLDPRALAFASIADVLRVPADHVHTSIAADMQAAEPVWQSWFADARVNPGAGEFYDRPCWGNPGSFAEKFIQSRYR
ncbi:MAG: hypothetical protein KC457_32155 [Myxococcales bacterium]|nr:hypothetical protein [Myxococcales bacterium]